MIYRLLLLLSLATLTASSQTYVSGVILDQDRQAVAFANVVFNNSGEGVISDIDGHFILESENNYSSITVSFVGYESLEVVLDSKMSSQLEIILKPGFELDEVLVVNRPKKRLKKNDNPAYKIMRGIWANKKENGLKLAKFYEYEKYSSTEVGLNNMDQEFLKKLLRKDYDSIVSIIQQDKRNKKFYVPIYLKEKIEKIYGNNSTKDELIKIEAEKDVGIQQEGFIFERISNVFKTINIYDNNIELLNRTFVSPLSKEGFGSYDYVLQDSIVSDNHTKYRIYFFPRRQGDLVFEGHFVVTDQVFSVNSVSMKTNPNINLNLVRNLYFEKTFSIQNDSLYLPKTNTYEADFTLLTKSEKEKGLYVKRTEIFQDYDFDVERSTSFYQNSEIKLRKNQFNREKEYWQNSLPVAVNNSQTEKILLNLQGNRKIKRITSLLRTLSNGYMKLSDAIEFGSIWNTFSINDVEGFRVSAGFRTFNSIDDRFRLKGRLAYGERDQQFKYFLDAKYLLTYQPRIAVGLSYMNDIEQLGSRILTSVGNTPQGLGTTSLFSRGDNYFLSRIKKVSAHINLELIKNFQLGLNYSNSHIASAAPKQFSINFFDPSTRQERSLLVDNSLEFYMLFTPRRNLFGYGVERRFGQNIFPSFLLSFQKGLEVGAGQTNYSKLLFSYNQPLKLGKYGILDNTFEAGKIFGDAQLSVLSPIPANQTYNLVPNTFSLLNYYDFIADEFLIGHFEHHFNGFLLNRVPMINKLKLRSLLTFRGVIGSIDQNNIAINRSSIIYDAPTQMYYEYGMGVENIGFGNLRIFRIDCIWRSEFNNPNTTAPKFGIRLGMTPDF